MGGRSGTRMRSALEMTRQAHTFWSERFPRFLGVGLWTYLKLIQSEYLECFSTYLKSAVMHHLNPAPQRTARTIYTLYIKKSHWINNYKQPWR